ncbi:MAG: efflux RND transporter periplasmic adaptor subunit [Rhodanobacteraceae bacterium]|mgnify:FL=1|jgi:multidrug resistance efflux pump|nr:efflux RND transporter periplasmic adaptor subunit [Rhodanobacteraceae bacterium]MBL0040416.1 efflux RND transporter periplasmic adaptor subunit [Xanthomonadales bacterium]MBP6078133.1 efflux RND transporter periplasmic adaptor subunit [Xanthomonadales bacterium]MBP7622494.1 efflux RND transporter periplasmic adaptor subunit [Xanthomonadales bacterium]
MKTIIATSLLLASLSLAAAELSFDGEIAARESAAISPPAIDDLWQLTLTQLAPDGTPVKKDQVVAAFDSSEVMRKLTEKQSALKEKETQRERLRLELAERVRTEALATAQAKSNAEKATRKADQPVDIVRRVDYQKLVIEREQAEKQLALATRRELAAAEQRKQEWRLVEAELTQLRGEVERSQKAMQELNVKAPRDGIILHQSNWQGEKFDVGSQVFRGQSVAQIPDVSTLIARVAVPETEIRRVSVGMQARVIVEGGAGQAIEGKVSEIGRAVRSKSRSQLVPVVDAVVSFDPKGQALKPGQPVRVVLVAATEKQP